VGRGASTAAHLEAQDVLAPARLLGALKVVLKHARGARQHAVRHVRQVHRARARLPPARPLHYQLL